MGDAPAIADDGDLCPQVIYLDRAVGLGPGAPHGHETVTEANQPHHQHDHQQRQQGAQQRMHGNPPSSTVKNGAVGEII